MSPRRPGVLTAGRPASPARRPSSLAPPPPPPPPPPAPTPLSLGAALAPALPALLACLCVLAILLGLVLLLGLGCGPPPLRRRRHRRRRPGMASQQQRQRQQPGRRRGTVFVAASCDFSALAATASTACAHPLVSSFADEGVGDGGANRPLLGRWPDAIDDGLGLELDEAT